MVTHMNNDELYIKYRTELFNDLEEPTPPDLVHYTSMQTLECILRDKEIWFSNPLFMNDLEELRFGMNEGARSC